MRPRTLRLGLALALSAAACSAPEPPARGSQPFLAVAASPLPMDPPRGPAALTLRSALVAESERRWDDAATLFREATVQDPAEPSATFGLARSLAALGRPTEARAAIDELLAASRPTVALLTAAGAAAMGLGDGEAAVDLYGRALLLQPGDPALSCEVAWVDLLAGRHDLVIATLEPLPLASLPPDLLGALGRSALLEGRPELAAAALAEQVRQQPGVLQGWLDLARARLLLDQTDAAMEAVAGALVTGAMVTGAMVTGPGAADTQVLLGHVYARSGRRTPALAAYAEAIRLGGDRRALDPLVARLQALDAEDRP